MRSMRARASASWGSTSSAGGTSTHHHAVGRMHRPSAYDVQRPDLFAESMRAVKKRLDPNGILNPGTVFD